ncbi:MAG: hypothetical protein WAN43_19240 [Rhodomicrobium sp.]|jgi:hypothetical protein
MLQRAVFVLKMARALVFLYLVVFFALAEVLTFFAPHGISWIDADAGAHKYVNENFIEKGLLVNIFITTWIAIYILEGGRRLDSFLARMWSKP